MEVRAIIPTESSIQELVSRLSSDDRDELLIQGADPEWAIRFSIAASEESVAVYVSGQLACITGVNLDSDLDDVATPWLLATGTMTKYPKQVLKYSRALVSRWGTRYLTMHNYVDARHIRARRWLEFLGAKGTLIPEHGIYRQPFYHFTFGEAPCVSH